MNVIEKNVCFELSLTRSIEESSESMRAKRMEESLVVDVWIVDDFVAIAEILCVLQWYLWYDRPWWMEME